MKFRFTATWLARHLAHADDSIAAAAGTTLEELARDAERRTVTPAVLADVPTEFGKVVRYVREQRSWSRSRLAELADVDELEIESIETKVGYDPKPRTVVQLADTLSFSRARLQELAGHIRPKQRSAVSDVRLPYAAHSRPSDTISEDDFETIRALVRVLSER